MKREQTANEQTNKQIAIRGAVAHGRRGRRSSVLFICAGTLIKRGHAPIIAIHYLPIGGRLFFNRAASGSAKSGSARRRTQRVDSAVAERRLLPEREQLAQRPLRAAAISVVRRPPLFYPFDFSLIWLLRPRNSPPDLRLTLPGCVSVENIRKRRRRRSLRFPQQVSAKPWALFSLLTTPRRHAHVYKDLLYFPFSLRRVFFKRKPHSL